MKDTLTKFTHQSDALDASHGTSLKGHLYNTTYNDLYETFGPPTFDDVSSDSKVQFEWVFDFNGNTYTIYDWKTFSQDYTLNELTKWNIGGKEYYGDFSDHIEALIDKSKQL